MFLIFFVKLLFWSIPNISSKLFRLIRCYFWIRIFVYKNYRIRIHILKVLYLISEWFHFTIFNLIFVFYHMDYYDFWVGMLIDLSFQFRFPIIKMWLYRRPLGGVNKVNILKFFCGEFLKLIFFHFYSNFWFLIIIIYYWV